MISSDSKEPVLGCWLSFSARASGIESQAWPYLMDEHDCLWNSHGSVGSETKTGPLDLRQFPANGNSNSGQV